MKLLCKQEKNIKGAVWDAVGGVLMRVVLDIVYGAVRIPVSNAIWNVVGSFVRDIIEQNIRSNL